VTLEIGAVPVPNHAVKIKLDGKVLGELDTDSIKQLEAFNYIKNGNQLSLKLMTISESKENAFALATSPNGNLLRINKISFYDYQGETFNDEHYRKLTLEVSPSKTRDAVFLNGKPLGVLHFKKDKEALKELGVLKQGKLTPVEATLQSNFMITVMKVDPETIEYPQVWTKETQIFGQQLNQLLLQQQQQFENVAPILQKIKERPTILYATSEDKLLGLTQLVVDNHKVETVTKWLTEKDVAIAPVPAEDVPLETKKGLAVFNLVNSSIPESVYQAMTKKFGDVIESEGVYREKVRSLPDRPKSLNPPQLVVSTAKVQAIPQTLQPQISTNELKTETEATPKQELPLPNVTIDNLTEWYSAADKLGKPEAYKQRIVEVANQFKTSGQLSLQALAAMGKDTKEYESISRLTKIAQRIGDVSGQRGEDGFTYVRGRIYDLAFNPQTKDLAITQKDGEIILSLQSGKVQSNKVTPEILQAFENANTQIDKNQAQSRAKNREFHR